jgi:hypothetical protein
MKLALARAATLCAIVASGQAVAMEEVGRTRFALPAGNWQPVVQYQQEQQYLGGEYSNTLFTKIYQLPGAGAVPRALLVVTSTGNAHSRGPGTWMSKECPPSRPKFFTADYDSNKSRRTRECVVVNPAFVAAVFFRGNESALAGFGAQNVQLPKVANSLRGEAANTGGNLLQVNLIVGRDFIGLAGSSPAAADTHEVAPALVAWAEVLQEAVRAAVYSTDGSLALPPIEFESR